MFNLTAEDIDLAGWRLVRQTEDGGAEKEIVSFGEGDLIVADGYFLIEGREAATEIEGDKVKYFVLLNTGERVRLYDDEEKVVDEANFLQTSEAKGWWAGSNDGEGIAMERSDAEGLNEENNWHTYSGDEMVAGRYGTPGAANSDVPVNHAPMAVISGPVKVMLGEEIVLSAEDSEDEDGDELEYSWFLGDGESAKGVEVIYKYKKAGTYTVTLQVADEELSDEAVLKVEVIQPKYSDEVAINEFLPNPKGSDAEGEFIELIYNGEGEIDLAG